MASEHEILECIKRLRKAIEDGSYIYIDRQDEDNLEFLLQSGIVPREIDEILCTLERDDYVSGPEPDHLNPYEIDIWKFKKTYQGFKIYIKFKLFCIDDDCYIVKLLSFHDYD